jgi:hypothetical protein
MNRFGIAVLVTLMVGCGQPPSKTVATLLSATGQQSLNTQSNGNSISGFVFINQGSHEVTLDHMQSTLTDGQVLGDEVGLVLSAGQQVTYLVQVQNHQTKLVSVAKLSFNINGTTEKLSVETTDETSTTP